MIGFKLANGAATLTLDRPERANALDGELVDALGAAIDRALAEGARAILLAASGRAFCAGGMLGGALPEDAGAILEDHLNPLMLKLADLPVPLVAAVNGAAAGAGASLALAADVIVAGASSFFVQAFVNVGLSPDCGASWLLPRALGWHRAMAMMMLGERLGAQEAQSLGLVWKVVEDEALGDEARALVARLASGPTQSYARVRRLARRALEIDFATALDAERKAQFEAGRTQDFREGVAAFRERRRPSFSGR